MVQVKEKGRPNQVGVLGASRFLQEEGNWCIFDHIVEAWQKKKKKRNTKPIILAATQET